MKVVLGVLFAIGCGKDPVHHLGDAPGTGTDGSIDGPIVADAAIDAAIDAAPDASLLCGNNVVDTGEDCDGAAPTDTSCVKEGFATGSIGCSACKFVRTECTAATPNLTVWYRFEDAAAATAAADSSGHTINATAHGTVAFANTGIIGKAIRFDGTTGYLDAGTPAAVTNMPAVTAEAWVNLDGQTMFGCGVVAKTADNNNADFALIVNNSPAGAPNWISSATDSTYGYRNIQGAGGPAVNGVWVHLAGVYEVASNTRKLYVNGVEVTTGGFGQDVAAPMNETGPLHVGNYVWNATQETGFLNGRVDEVKVWNVMRTQAQICSDAGGIPGAPGACSMTPILP